MKEVAISWNYINRGHHARPLCGKAIIDGIVRNDFGFIPSENRFQEYVVHGFTNGGTVAEVIERLKRSSDMCRIWIHYEDGSKKNIWYYNE